MKTKIDKSKVMTRAWKIYRTSIDRETWTRMYTFAEALKRAWSFEKMDAKNSEELNNPNRQTVYATFHQGAATYYQNAPQGRYFGD